MKKVLIDKGVYSTKVAIIGKDGPEMIHYDIEKDAIDIGDIYVAVVKSLNKSNKSAFLDIGVSACYLGEGANDLKVGDLLIIQIDKAGHDEKLPVATRDISILGKYSVFLSRGNGIKYSRKVHNINEMKQITDEMENHLNAGQGAIIRSSAKLSLECEIIAEFENLVKTYNSFEQKCRLTSKPTILKKAENYYIEMLISKDENFEIITNDKAVIAEIKPHLTESDIVIFKETSLFSIYGIGNEIMLKKKYDANGAMIVIEKTEAMTVIDVNSGNKLSTANREASILDINISVCHKIVELIILKNISGIIIIDFISMKDKKNNNILVECLKKAFYKDYNQVKVMEITSLGLVQVTRKRSSEDVYSKFTQSCDSCGGKGFKANEILMKIQAEEKIQLKGYEYIEKYENNTLDIFNHEEKRILQKKYD